MNDVIRIGKATKWRGRYSDTMMYYKENVVTMCGSVFICLKDTVIGKAPLAVTDETSGIIAYDNTDVWECVVDALNFYNRALNGIQMENEAKKDSINGITSGAVYAALSDAVSSLSEQMEKKIKEQGIYIESSEYEALVESGNVNPEQTYYVYEEE